MTIPHAPASTTAAVPLTAANSATTTFAISGVCGIGRAPSARTRARLPLLASLGAPVLLATGGALAQGKDAGFPSAATPAGPTYTVVSCNDGDTCKIKSTDNVTLKVRLVGIDAPEFKGDKKKNQPLAAESKEFLNGLVQGRSVRLVTHGADAFNRNLAEVWMGSTNVNVELVRNGLAEVYRGRPPRGLDLDAYAKAEAEARATKKGVWALQKYESPKDWRRRNK